MWASPMMAASPNDVCLRHMANITSLRPQGATSLRPTGATSFRQRRNIISPQAIQKRESVFMKDNKLADLSMDFSVDIINLVKKLKSGHESIISNQIGRSGTSIGANIHEAQYAQGKKDFISKLEIALKEASETGYWLELLYRTRYIDEQTFKALSSKCTSLRVILIASCKTAKKKNDEPV